ncbi:MAG: hypothetical protein C4558_07460 [Dehalococcoidia bacterium]|nr:MAG: hypothetical protein C4558_07460 [Dehalococcoidia bacterium]
MAAETFTFTISKGRAVEFYYRAENNDPANSALVVIPMATLGSEAQGQTLDSLAAVESDGNFSEQTGGGWGRTVLESSQLASFPSPDDSNHRYAIQVPEIVHATPDTSNDLQGFLIGFDYDTTAGTDSNILPVTAHAVTVTANDVDVVINVGDFFRAS